MGNVNIITSLFVIGMILILAFLYYWNIKSQNPFCKTLIEKALPTCWISSIFINAGGEQGSQCVIDSDCKGWSVGGNIACCGSKCITKLGPFETCIAYCEDHDCGVSKCQSCTGAIQCKGFWPFGTVNCIGDGYNPNAPVVNGKCVKMDSIFQGPQQFINKYGSGENWCRTHNRSENL